MTYRKEKGSGYRSQRDRICEINKSIFDYQCLALELEYVCIVVVAAIGKEAS